MKYYINVTNIANLLRKSKQEIPYVIRLLRLDVFPTVIPFQFEFEN
jgi:hypothetical protein